MRYLHFYYILLLIISAFSQSFQTHTKIPQDLKTKIHDTILKLKNNPTHLNTLQEWIKQPSFAGQESGVQQLIADRLKQLGFQIDMYEMDGDQLRKHPYFVSPRSDFNNSPIVVGVLKGESRNIEIDELGRQEAKAGRSIILNGHVDVVPVGDLNAWKISKDPFSGLVKDGRVYGRGSTDMKGGIFSSLIAIEVLKELNISLKGDLIFQSVVEEESGGSGTLSTIIRGYKADGAIIPEPTNMKIFPKQQGSAWFRITVYGLSAHGGTRYDGVSAIEKAVTVIKAVQDLEAKRNERVKKVEPLYKDLPIPVPINMGIIKGGKWPSSVADYVEIEGRFGVSPNEKMNDAKQELADTLKALESKDEWFKSHPIKLEWFGGQWLPGNVELDHPIVQELKSAFIDVKNTPPVIEASPWGTDAGYLSNVGGIPAIVFGPGTTELAHQSDESISIDKMYECGEILALLLLRWCGYN